MMMSRANGRPGDLPESCIDSRKTPCSRHPHCRNRVSERVQMARVVIGRLSDKTARKIAPKRGAIGKKRLVGAEGVRTLRTLDAGSKTFDSDLTYVFGKNVEKARRENKAVAGVADIAPRKD